MMTMKPCTPCLHDRWGPVQSFDRLFAVKQCAYCSHPAWLESDQKRAAAPAFVTFAPCCSALVVLYTSCI